jgi:hypothetical protein
MAANLIINGVTYSGTPLATGTPFKPSSFRMTDTKIGRTVVNANGGRTFVARSVQKRTWSIGWALANDTTRAALRTLAELATTFPFVDQLGVSRSCQVEADDYSEEWLMSDTANVAWYACTLTIREA